MRSPDYYSIDVLANFVTALFVMIVLGMTGVIR
jgi:hypothetical protein